MSDENKPLMSGDVEEGYQNPNISEKEMAAAMGEGNANMIDGSDGNMGAQDVLEKGSAGDAAPLSDIIKDTKDAVGEVFDKKDSKDAKAKDGDEGSSAKEAFLAALTVIAFITFDCGKIIMEAVSGTGHSSFNMAVFLAFISMVNIVLSIGTTALLDGTKGVKACFSESIWLFIMPSLFFSLSQLLNILQNSHIPGDLRKVFQQLRIPITALMGRFLMGHGYTGLQWYIIATVLCVVPCFMISTGPAGLLRDPAQSEGKNILLGFCLAILSNIAACAGSLLAEKYCKSASKTPFYIQKFQIEVWTFAAGLCNICMFSPFVGALGDLMMEQKLMGKEFKKNTPLGVSKAMFFTYSPFKSNLAYGGETLERRTNRFDSVNEEMELDESFQVYVPSLKDYVPVTLPGNYDTKFTTPEYNGVVSLVQKIAAVKTARAANEYENAKEGELNDYHKTRTMSAEYVAAIGEEDPKNTVWSKLSSEGRFAVAHGLSPALQSEWDSDIIQNFGFTFGAYKGEGEEGIFISEAPWQQESKKLTSWWLKQQQPEVPKTIDDKTGKVTAKVDLKLWKSAPAPVFTHKLPKRLERAQLNKAFDDWFADNMENEKTKISQEVAYGSLTTKMDDSDPESDGVTVRALEKNAVYYPEAHADFKTKFDKEEVTAYPVWLRYDLVDTTTYPLAFGASLECVTKYPTRVIELRTDKQLSFDKIEADHTPFQVKVHDKTWEGPSANEKCTLKVPKAPYKKAAKDLVKQWNEAKASAKEAKETAEKEDEKNDEKKAAKAAKAAEKAKKEALALKLPITLVNVLKKSNDDLTAAAKQVAGDYKFAVAKSKLDDSALNVGDKKEGYRYPGTVGAGTVSKTGARYCDQATCKISDKEWKENFGYMRDNWQNRPQNPVFNKDDTAQYKNPFSWAEMHEYQAFPLPGAVWTWYAVLALVANIGQSWLSGLIAKVLSSLWKNLCQAAALALVVVLQRLATDEYPKVPRTIGLIGGPKITETVVALLAVLLTVWTFAQAPKAPKKH